MNWSHFKTHLGLLLILVIYFLVTFYTSWQIPLSIGPDESAHFELARFIEKEGYLPFTPEDREAAGFKSDQPPLNSILIAAAFLWGDVTQPPFVKLTNDTPRHRLAVDGVVDRSRIFNLAVSTEDPLAGEILFWRFGRWMSIIFSGITLVVIYFVGLKIFEHLRQSNLWALAMVMIVAFMPTFTFISSVFSYENLLGLWLALYLLVAIHILKGARAKSLYLLAGLFVGLAIVTKLSALPALLSLVLLALIAGRRIDWPNKWAYLTRPSLSLLGVLLAAGWWFALLEFRLNKVAELGWWAGLLHPLASDDASSIVIGALGSGTFASIGKIETSDVLAWGEYLFKTFWSFKGQNQGHIHIILLMITLLIGLGLLRVVWQKKEARLGIAFLSFHIGLFVILPWVRLVVTGFQNVAGQGQHVLFPALGAVAILSVVGLAAWLPKSFTGQWLGGVLLGVGLLVWNIIHLLYLYQPANPVPVRTVPPITPSSASQVELDLGPMVLKGYELTGLTPEGFCCAVNRPALEVNLYWVAEEFAPEDYITTVRLVDNQGQAQTIWMGHGANGRYPTRAWIPGDIVRQELHLPLMGLQPGHYKVDLEVKGRQASLATADGLSTFTLTEIELAHPWLLPPSNKPFEIWQAGHEVNEELIFNERATIQITAQPSLELKLLGPDQVERDPVEVAGQTHIFMVDPIWPKGDYQLSSAAGNYELNQQAASILTVQGIKRRTQIPDSQIIIKANFADQIRLLGANLPKRHLTASEQIPVQLHWQAIQTIPTDFIMFTRLRDQTGQAWSGRDRWPQENHSPLLWAAGEVIEDGFTIETNLDTPDGLYYVDVGFYMTQGEAAIPLPLVEEGQMTGITSVPIGPFKVGDTLPPGVTFDQPKFQFSVNQSFGNRPKLTLLGFDLIELRDQESVPQENKVVKLVLYWRTESSVSIDYTTFVHILNSKDGILAQKDQAPLDGVYPTSLWRPGEIITDEIVLTVPANPPADRYRMVVGLYDLNTGLRLIVPGHQENSLTLAEKEFTRS